MLEIFEKNNFDVANRKFFSPLFFYNVYSYNDKSLKELSSIKISCFYVLLSSE